MLCMFCNHSDLDEFNWSKTPFLNTKYDEVWATDGHAVMTVKKGFVDVDAEKEISLPWMLRACDWKDGISVSVSRFLDAIAACPTEDEVEENFTDDTCPECGGSGVVTWSYIATFGSESFYDREFECPVCDGKGFVTNTTSHPTGRKVPVKGAAIHIRTAEYAVYQIQRLVDAARKMDIDEVRILYIPYEKFPGSAGLVIGLTEDIRVAVMPFISDDPDNIVNLDV